MHYLRSGSTVELTFQRESHVFSVDLIRRANDMTPEEVQELLNVSRSCCLSFLSRDLFSHPSPAPSRSSPRVRAFSVDLSLPVRTHPHART